MTRPTWTPHQGIAYEVAREVLNTKRARLAAAVGTELKQPIPRIDVVVDLERQMLDVGAEIDALDVTKM